MIVYSHYIIQKYIITFSSVATVMIAMMIESIMNGNSNP